MSKQEQRGNSSFFIASAEHAITTSIVMEMNNASFWKCIHKHLFELNSKLKMTDGNMPNWCAKPVNGPVILAFSSVP